MAECCGDRKLPERCMLGLCSWSGLPCSTLRDGFSLLTFKGFSCAGEERPLHSVFPFCVVNPQSSKLLSVRRRSQTSCRFSCQPCPKLMDEIYLEIALYNSSQSLFTYAWVCTYLLSTVLLRDIGWDQDPQILFIWLLCWRIGSRALLMEASALPLSILNL